MNGGVESGRMEALMAPLYGRVDPISRVTFHKHRMHKRYLELRIRFKASLYLCERLPCLLNVGKKELIDKLRQALARINQFSDSTITFKVIDQTCGVWPSRPRPFRIGAFFSFVARILVLYIGTRCRQRKSE